MPNHITNTLEIHIWHPDREDHIDAMRYEIGAPDDGVYIDFEKIIEPPDHPAYRAEGLTMQDMAENPGVNWYDWNTKHWGTKWNAYSQELLEVDNNRLKIQFDTAWSPPEPVIAALRDKLENLYPEEQGYEVYVVGSWIEEGYQSAGVF